MTDFELGSREYPHMRKMIASVLPDFATSQAYQRLSEADRELPTVVCGAFARYLNRLLSDEQEADSANLEASFRVMERLATSPEAEVQNTLVVEIFEHLDLTRDELDRFHRRLGPAARKLYNRWIGVERNGEWDP